MKLIDDILKLTPGDGEAIDEWYIDKLAYQIDKGIYPKRATLGNIVEKIVAGLKDYKHKHGIENIVVGQSGGIDSALTAALFKQAGWITHGVTMPIHQIEEETNRGIENIDALQLEKHHYDLSEQFDGMLNFLGTTGNTYKGQQRQGNIRARLRMITLYNLAHKLNGCVASTDNFSELAAGFWTLHGDVGDIAPIQSLTKSWEVPALADMLDIPKNTITALPTDGLGISTSDADQLGMNYLEFDILLFELLSLPEINEDNLRKHINTIEDDEIRDKAWLVANRVKGTAFKRANPFNLVHPVFSDRFAILDKLDRSL
ncbi:NAD(+) synthase [bacterium]|nr:NAD(+) synthase [bacterium]